MENTRTYSHRGGKHVIYTHPGEGFKFWKQYTLTFCHKLSRKTFWQLCSRWMERQQLPHSAVENMSYTPILAKTSRSESSTLSRFVTNLAENLLTTLFLMNGKDTNLLTRRRKHVVYTHPGEGFQFWKQYTRKFCHKLRRKTLLAWWLAEHSSLRHPGDSFQIWKQYTLTFCQKLSRKTYGRLCYGCMEKTSTGSYHPSKYVIA